FSRALNGSEGLRLVFGFEGGDGFDEASDREGVADAALAYHEVQTAAEARQGDGEFHHDRDAGAVNLRNVVKVDDDFAGALLDQILHKFEQALAGIADGEAAMHANIVDSGSFTRGDFQGWMQGHGPFPSVNFKRRWLAARQWRQ